MHSSFPRPSFEAARGTIQKGSPTYCVWFVFGCTCHGRNMPVCMPCTEPANLYHDDLSSPDNVDMELLCWKAKWGKHEWDISRIPKSTIKQCYKIYFKHPHSIDIQLINDHLCAVLSVTSCTCQRSISGFKRFRTT